MHAKRQLYGWLLLLIALSSMVFPAAGVRGQDQQPIVSALFKSFQTNLDLFAFIGAQSGDVRLARDVSKLVSQLFGVPDMKLHELPGIDKEQPCGVLILANNDVDSMVAFVKPTDLDAMLAHLAPVLGEATRNDAGVYQLTLGQRPVFLKQQGDWLFAAFDDAHLASLPDPATIVGGIGKSYDMTLRLDFAGAPEEVKKRHVDQLTGIMTAGLQQAPGESAEMFALRKQMADHQASLLNRLFGEADRVTLGWTMDNAASMLRGELFIEPHEGTPLAAQLAATEQPSLLSAMVNPEDTVCLHVNMPLDSAEAQQVSTAWNAYRDAVKQVAQTSASGDAANESLGQLTDELFDIGRSAFDGGRVNFAVKMIGTKAPYNMVLGVAISRRAELEKWVEQFAELGKNDPEIASIKLNAAEQDGVKIHSLELKASKDKADKIGQLLVKFFRTPLFHIAVTDDRAYVAVGPQGLQLIKDVLKPSTEQVPSVLFSAKTSVLNNLLVQTMENQQIGSMLGLLGMNLTQGVEGPVNDRVLVRLQPKDGTLHGDLEVNNGILRVIGMIIPAVPAIMGAAGGAGGAGGGAPSINF